jgi:hypothetical protein
VDARERTDEELMRIDRSVFEIVSIDDESDDRAFWMTRPASERWRALELLRRIAYGEDRATARLQRILEVVEVEWR